MNEQVKQYLRRHSAILAGRVLEVGSFDVNGAVRDVVPVTIGIDMRPGPGVDRVLRAEFLPEHFEPETFDAVVCCETLEHVEHWREAVVAMWHVLKGDGWLVITVPTIAKPRHNYPNDYWRWDVDLVHAIWPQVDVSPTWSAGIGWAVQKCEPLPDLSEVHLWPVD